MTSSDSAKYSVTRSVAQFLCDSWASCSCCVTTRIITWHVRVTYYKALCWSEWTVGVTVSCHRPSSWNVGSTCAAKDCSRLRNKLAYWRMLSCSVSATWTCRRVAYLQQHETLCRHWVSSLYNDRETPLLTVYLLDYSVFVKSMLPMTNVKWRVMMWLRVNFPWHCRRRRFRRFIIITHALLMPYSWLFTNHGKWLTLAM